MKMNNLVTCQRCQSAVKVNISQIGIVTYEEKNTTLLSARERKDGKWGFECICGQDSRIAASELPFIDQLVIGHKETLIKTATVGNELGFVITPLSS